MEVGLDAAGGVELEEVAVAGGVIVRAAACGAEGGARVAAGVGRARVADGEAIRARVEGKQVDLDVVARRVGERRHQHVGRVGTDGVGAGRAGRGGRVGRRRRHGGGGDGRLGDGGRLKGRQRGGGILGQDGGSGSDGGSDSGNSSRGVGSDGHGGSSGSYRGRSDDFADSRAVHCRRIEATVLGCAVAGESLLSGVAADCSARLAGGVGSGVSAIIGKAGAGRDAGLALRVVLALGSLDLRVGRVPIHYRIVGEPRHKWCRRLIASTHLDPGEKHITYKYRTCRKRFLSAARLQ